MSLKLQRGLFSAGERVCCAVSGGADSVAMLLALHEANTVSAQNKLPLGLGLSAVHVHHGLRGAEADADEAFVRELCARLDVPLVLERVDTAARRLAEREGVEEAARALRYQVFDGLMMSGAADVVATAHTLDDQAETAMMKLLRGAWTEGLGGISAVVETGVSGGDASKKQILRFAQHDNFKMNVEVGEDDNVESGGAMTPPFAKSAKDGPPSFRDRPPGLLRGRILRPMLEVRRAEIEAYLRERGQAWREDATNADVLLTRNRVRHELMPVLRTYNPQAAEMLANVAALARDDEAYWQAEVARVLPQVLLPGTPVRGGGRAVATAVGEQTFALELERLRAMPAALRSRVVRAAARQMGVRLTFVETAKLLAVAGFVPDGETAAKAPTKLELRQGLRAERSARELRLSKTAQNAAKG